MSPLSLSQAAGAVTAATDPTTFIKAPSISYSGMSPILIVLGGACVGVLIEALVPRAQRYASQLTVTVGTLVAALIAVIALHDRSETTVSGALAVDGATLFLQGTILVLAVLSVLLIADRGVEPGSAIVASAAVTVGSPADRRLTTSNRIQTEVHPLALFAVSGMLIFPASNNLLLMFVALEVLSLPLYLMAGLARRRRLLSQEAAIKYFLLGAFASAFFLYGVALLYGYANSVDLGTILAAQSTSSHSDSLLYLGFGLLMVGLLFKAGIAPFHSWTPDVYQGSATPVTSFMASCTKIAAFGAMLRLFYVGFGADRWDWQPMLWIIAILTMLVGSVLAVVQTDVKRMLAYSSVAHTGFLLTGLLGVQATSALGPHEITSLQAVLFYLATYGPATVGTFAIVTLVRDAGGEATSFAKWSGLGRKSPLVAGAFGFLLLSMAGIPLTAGFVGKWAVFEVALASGAWPVVIVAIAASVISVFFYVRVILLMFFADPVVDGSGVEGAAVTRPSLLTSATIAVCVAATLFLGVVPGPVLDLAGNAGSFIR